MDTVISSERLNFIIAVCAILISGASFYATYLQAKSAEQQVKAMTWPLIEFTHGNYNVETREKNLTLSLGNAGVGPAIVKSVSFVFEGERHPSLQDFLSACCDDAYRDYMEEVKGVDYSANVWTMTTSPTAGIILPVDGQLDFLSLVSHPSNDSLWQAINKQRWNLKLDVCYCSLLENCYTTGEPGQVIEVKACRAP